MLLLSYTELIGYVASLVVVSSFLMKDIKKLRIISITGCLLFIIYGVLKDFSIPIIFTNTSIISINMYYIIKTV
jgi:hypothetical protein